MARSFYTEWLGLIPYEQAQRLQSEQAQKVRIEPNAACIFGLEHPPTITLGKRARRDLDVINPSTVNTMAVIETDRGGQATLHSPGQLVIYPVLPLKGWGLGPRAYVDVLMKATQVWLKGQGIDCWQDPSRPGLYTARGKIAFVGIRLEHGVSRHGIAVNIRNSVRLFSHIRSCGQSHETMDRVVDHHVGLDLHEAFLGWTEEFARTLRFS